MSKTTVFHSLTFRDIDSATAFLRVIGFTDAGTYRDDAGNVVHAQYNWREGGGAIMFGQAREAADATHAGPGTAQCYCVVPEDSDVDQVHDAALSAGGTSLRAPEDQDYGGRGCTVADPEGNRWSFGSYAGQ